jgi:AraC-like DNA-binding protein
LRILSRFTFLLTICFVRISAVRCEFYLLMRLKGGVVVSQNHADCQEDAWLLMDKTPPKLSDIRKTARSYRLRNLSSERLVEFVESILVNELPKIPTVRAISEYLFTTPRTLGCRLSLAGTTYRQIVNDVRLRQAKKGLANSAMSISQVSVANGYRDASNFSKAFKLKTGQSPSQYRAILRSE